MQSPKATCPERDTGSCPDDLTTINGLEAHIGSYRRNVNNVGRVLARVVHIRHNRSVFVLGGLGPVDEFTRVEREVNRSIRSFRPLGQAEADDIVPNEIALYVAREGDTWQAIAQQGGEGIVTASTLAILNDYPVNEQSRPGDRLKYRCARSGNRRLAPPKAVWSLDDPPPAYVSLRPVRGAKVFHPYMPLAARRMHEPSVTPSKPQRGKSRATPL